MMIPPASGLTPLKRLIPRRLKAAIRTAYRRRTLDVALRHVARLQGQQTPSRLLLNDLQAGWDNDGMAARTDYLEEVCRVSVRTQAAILECGSGLTTILLGLMAGRRGVPTWSLEHLPDWRDRVAAALGRHRIGNVHVCLAPLRDYAGFAWYDAPLASMPPTFDLVVCDGPPSQTRGGRYGMLPVVGARLGERAVILLDDVDRPGELEVLGRWCRESSMATRTCRTSSGAFALATRS